LLEQESKNKIDLSSIISNDKKIISLFSGSRSSEIKFTFAYFDRFYQYDE
jgi:lipid A disaccharide synthetase